MTRGHIVILRIVICDPSRVQTRNSEIYSEIGVSEPSGTLF